MGMAVSFDCPENIETISSVLKIKECINQVQFILTMHCYTTVKISEL